MTKYESKGETISLKDEVVFATLSDFKNLEKHKDREELLGKLKDATFEPDSCQINVDGMGCVKIKIVERIPNKKIKLELENFPFEVKSEMLISKIAEEETELKIILNAELPTMIKMMVGGKIQNAVELMAKGIAAALNK